MHEEYGLDDEREDGVGDHDRDGAHHLGPAAGGAEGGVCDVLEPDGVDDPAQQVEGHHPQRREGEGEEGQRARPQLLRPLGAGAEEDVEDGAQRGQEELLEEHDRRPEDAAVQHAALERALKDPRLLVALGGSRTLAR